MAVFCRDLRGNKHQILMRIMAAGEIYQLDTGLDDEEFLLALFSFADQTGGNLRVQTIRLDNPEKNRQVWLHFADASYTWTE